MSPQARPASGHPSPADDNVRHMNTQKFLHTDLKTYLAKDEHVTCISCQKCVKIKDKMVQYKYNQGMKSLYSANYANTRGHVK